VTSVSESLRQDTLDSFDIKKEIEVIPNFIDLDLYRADKNCRRAQIAPNGEKIITHISNMRKVKRIPDIINVFAGIHAQEKSVLLMIGDGPEREKAEKQVRELGLTDCVKFFGKTNEVRRLLCMSDLFLLTSESESFGLVALEAMAASVPVLSTNAGGIPEVNIHGYTGYLSPVGDVTSMVGYGLELLQDPQKLMEFKSNATERAKAFGIESIVPRYEEAYERALAERFKVS
jgi:N-acetyl-alpha-D-glucosaminyl L-malate synthase BshA